MRRYLYTVCNTRSEATTSWNYRVDDWRRACHRFRKNRLSVVGLSIIVAVVIIAVFADVLSPFPEDSAGAIHFEKRFQSPSLAHPFGTDEAGRDVLSRTMYGIRISLYSSLAIQGLVVVVGVMLGMTAGYVGGMVSSIIMRTSDVFISVPPLALALVATTSFRPSLEIAMMAVSLAWWPWMARVVYGQVLKIKEEQFIEASLQLGKGPLQTMLEDVFPNCVSVITVKGTLDMGFVILFTASLSFLGLGAQPPIPELGSMISTGRKYLPEYWWLSVFPGLFIFLSVLGFSLLGDGLRDLFDVEID